MADELMHPVYLPFTKLELEQHFAPVAAAPDGRHVKYYEISLQRWAEYTHGIAAGQAAAQHAADHPTTNGGHQDPAPLSSVDGFVRAALLVHLLKRPVEASAGRDGAP
jgi:hypothetical protein